jgi:glutathione-regulated potassium-efflux system ancillary protein KefG
MRILVLAAHPRHSASIVQRSLRQALAGIKDLTLHDLYAAYPDFAIDIDAEQERLLAHDLIVLQHPFYWYSAPAILKEWLDLVLENGWAYGPGGTRLAGKFLMQVISTGGGAHLYHPDGRNRFSIETLLAPFNQTAHLCAMAYLRPFVVHAGRRLSADALVETATAYRNLIADLAAGRTDPLSLLAEGYRLPPGFATRAA